MKITSTAFENNGSIPAVYTCDGSGINPPLVFSEILPEAKGLALLMDDPDVPKSIRSDGMWDHWVVWNMPPSTQGIGEGEMPPGIVGRNTGGGQDYYNPCPPDGEHRYFFKLYALDIMLDLPAISSKADVEKAMQGHILAATELIGLYRRQ
ncbi:YbhB/YbcL family Raf kinase inhibitor-like protein [Candidatus Uhrbacteria bacterium]|nr:YbhB/YbcL family Raf kinase inhibitor-like protein [Candidatus Uhrbacteria bacterium]